ncbi:MAG TPA: RNB domain-containing ribonuclease [Acidimicrobiales bacterium]|nr:RNB domain-containing ribonuclease [Acidimicrobiales bacterium]
MPHPPLWLDADTPELRAGLARIREEFEVPGAHSPAAVDEADVVSRAVLRSLDGALGGARRDARHLELVTIDPPGSRDLDQALHIAARAGGWRVSYAIADVPAFVDPGGAVAAEVQDRGVTFYLPDHRSPLHPPRIGEDAGSLLPGQERPAVLWQIDLDGDGQVVGADLRRAVVRSRAQLTYAEVQAEVDSGRAGGTLAALAEVGQRRLALEAARDGVSLDLPSQRVVVDDGGRLRLEHEPLVASMGWNAQISLLTGMVAAEAMLTGGVGLLRTLPPPDEDVERKVRRTAKGLGLDWPEDASYQSLVRELDGSDPDEAAVLMVAARGLRGAGYLPILPGEALPADPAAVGHAAVAAPYAHVTAPLRRLCDRAAIEVCLALYAGQAVPDHVLELLPELPRAMARATAREGGAAKAVVDLVEALLLQPLIGEVVEATVVSSGPERSAVVLGELAVETVVEGVELPLSEVVPLRIESVDVAARTVLLAPA